MKTSKTKLAIAVGLIASLPAMGYAQEGTAIEELVVTGIRASIAKGFE